MQVVWISDGDEDVRDILKSATVCWICAAGGVVGSGSALSYMEEGGVPLSEREVVYRIQAIALLFWAWEMGCERAQVRDREDT